MAAPRSSRPTAPVVLSSADGDSRFDRRFAEILSHATDVFYEKGYEGASMRDLSRATGMSLAGLYYYFESKERLLYFIQKHTFGTILANLRLRLEGVSDPELQVRAIISNHLEYFLSNQKAMTVLSHEDEVLKGTYGEEVRAIKRDYYQTCRAVIERVQAERNARINARIAVLSLFGMMNWIYTWHRPRVDADASELAQQMGDIFLNGVLGSNGTRPMQDANSGAKTAARSRRTASSTN